MSSSSDKRRETLGYAIGYALALALTGAAFAAVRWPSFAAGTTLAIVFGLALVQVVVHFRFFLHVCTSAIGARRPSAHPVLGADRDPDGVGNARDPVEPAHADDVAMETNYDLIVIGSGPGGASLAQRLAPTGKRILILERGDYLPREEANWSSKAVFVDGRYQADETWTNAKGDTFSPALHYYVGGNSKVYGAALFRLRERDFGEVVHAGGVSPAWPLGYDAFAPYYDEAEALFHVHGQRGEDPLEPPTAHALSLRAGEARAQGRRAVATSSTGIGLKPFHLPLGILLDQKEDGCATPTSTCMRCSLLRRLSLPAQRQGGRAGDLHRSDAGARTTTSRC